MIIYNEDEEFVNGDRVRITEQGEAEGLTGCITQKGRILAYGGCDYYIYDALAVKIDGEDDPPLWVTPGCVERLI